MSGNSDFVTSRHVLKNAVSPAFALKPVSHLSQLFFELFVLSEPCELLVLSEPCELLVILSLSKDLTDIIWSAGRSFDRLRMTEQAQLGSSTNNFFSYNL